MVTVPRYTPDQVGTAPLPAPAATPQAFGAGLGRQLQEAGASTRGIAETVERQQLQDAEALARERDLAASEQINTLLNAEDGYLRSKGRDAVNEDRRTQVADRFQRILEGSLQGVTHPHAYERIEQSVRARLMRGRDAAASHHQRERRIYYTELSQARAASAADESIAAPQDAETFARARRIIDAEVAAQAELAGWAPDVVQREREKLTSALASAGVAAMIGQDVEAAAALLEQRGALLVGGAQAELSGRIDRERGRLAKLAEAEQRRAEREAAAELSDAREQLFGELDLQAARGELTAESIEEAPLLTDRQRAVLLRRLGQGSARRQRITETLRRLEAGDSFNSFLSDDRRAVNEVWEEAAEGMMARAAALAPEDQAPPDRAAVASAFAMRTGVVVDELAADTKAALASGDLAQAAVALERADMLAGEHRSIWKGVSGGAGIEKQVDRYKAARRVGFDPSVAAGHATQENADLAGAAKREAGKRFDQRATDANPEITLDDLTGAIRDRYGHWWRSDLAGPPRQMNDMLLSDAEDIFRVEFERARGNAELATEATLEMIGRTWGVSTVGGVSRVMKYPPERVAPHVGGSHDWIQQQLEQDLRGAPGVNWDDGDIVIYSDDHTISEIEAGREPAYRVLYEDASSGLMEELPSAFIPDQSVAETALQERFNQARAEGRAEKERLQGLRREAGELFQDRLGFPPLEEEGGDGS